MIYYFIFESYVADIDECKVNKGGCQSICVNTPGSFKCDCEPGYRLTFDRTTCEGDHYSNYTIQIRNSSNDILIVIRCEFLCSLTRR